MAIVIGSIMLMATLVGMGGYAYTQITKPLTDAWTFDGHRWTQTASVGPSRGDVAWDEEGRQLIMFAGGNPGHTWALGDGKWVALHTKHTPSIGEWNMASTHNGILLVGSKYEGFDSLAGTQTWLWHDRDWINLQAQIPTASTGSGPLAYDSNSDSLLMFWNAIYKWTGVAWSKVGPWSAESTTAAYDPNLNVFLSLGCASSDCRTWSWSDGGGGQQPAGDLPPTVAAAFGTLVYYPPIGKILLIADSGTDKEAVFEWSGASWVLTSTVGAPSARRYAAIGFDPASGLITMFGGCGHLSSCYGS